MSRYGDYSPRGPPERWNPERFERERGGRRSQVIERDHYEERDTYSNAGGRRRESSADDFYSRRPTRGGGGGERYEDDRFFEKEERYGPPARRSGGGGGGGFRERRYHEEDVEIDSFDGSPARGGRDRRYEDDSRFSGGRKAPPRPGQLIRRQSSLDTFDRKPMPRYGPPRHRSPPEVISIPGPGSRRRPSPRRASPPRYYEREEYEDIRIAEPDKYGDDNFRGWKEREVDVVRRRRRESSPHFKEREFVEEEIIEEKPFPRRGRTKMSARLVNKRAIIDIGYPFEDEYTADGEFVIILKALNKELIDEVLFRSKEYNERERERITYAIEAPPPPPDRGEIIERREIIIDKAPSEVPRSVREWDVMSGAISGGGKSEHGQSEHRSDRLSVHESHHSSHHGRGRSEHGSSHSTIKVHKHERSSSPSEKEIVIERKPSRSKSRHHSRHRSHGRHKTEYVEEDEVGESNAMKTGPLALVLPRRSKSRHGSKDERRVKEEIRELELEKERLRKERRHEKKYHHDSSSSDDAVIIERKGSHGGREDVKIEKDRRGGDSKIIKGMLATLT